MRMMLKVSMPTDASNAAVKDGKPGQGPDGSHRTLEAGGYLLLSRGPEAHRSLLLRPGERSAEFRSWPNRSFHAVNADITLIPVMNADDVGKGIE